MHNIKLKFKLNINIWKFFWTEKINLAHYISNAIQISKA